MNTKNTTISTPNILLVRHAHSVWNIWGKIGYTGESDRLTPQGISQAQFLGVDIQSKLKKLSLDTPILDIHRSPTHRTLQTFTHSTLHILGADFNIHTADPRLREIDMGSMIGKNPTEPMQIGDISTTYGRFFMSILASRDVPFPGGESREQVWKRMHEYMMSLDPEQVHIVYSHGVAISSLVHYILSLHTDTVHRAYTERVRIGNAEIHTFRTGVWWVEYVG